MATGGRIYQTASFGGVSGAIIKVLAALGAIETAEFFVGDDIISEFVGDVVSALNPFDNDNTNHPSPVVKSWENELTGLMGVKLQNGLMGAQKKDGTWTYWRPKKARAVLYSSGNNNRALINGYKAIQRDAKNMKKITDHFFPRAKPKDKVKIVRIRGEVVDDGDTNIVNVK